MKTIYKKLLFLLLLLPCTLMAQTSVEGVVVDSKTNQPLPGVNVNVQGTSTGTTTDFDGKFKLGKIKNGDNLVFSFIGYQSKTLQYTGQSSINVTMEEESSQLQEVVVQIGYGNVKKKDATGSVSLVTTKDFNKGANVTAENLLNGRVAGLTINTSGAPGSGSEIRIRGGSSLFAKNDPLIVIDGLPIENNTNTGSTSVLASINPATIESISVLKDASATAIYGSRASNGVIIITTKKGGKKLAVDYNFQYGSGTKINKVDVFGADEFRAIVTEQRPQFISQFVAAGTEFGNANTDWQEEIYRRTDYVDNNISLRGNLFNSIPTRLTIGNTYQEGIRLTNKFNRNTVSLAMNPSFLKDHLRFKVSANYANEKNRFTDAVEGSAIRFDPTQPVYDENSIYGGFFEYYSPSNGELTPQTVRNPVAQLLQTYDTGLNNRFYGNFEMDYKFHFFPDLRGVVNLGFDESNGERTKLAGADAATSFTNNNIPFGTNEFTESVRRNKLLDAYFVYTKKFTNLDFDFTAGYSYQKFENARFATGNVNNPLSVPVYTPETPVVLIGYFGRTNLNYMDKYLLTLSLRRDSSSRFSKENRDGYFPSAAFAWKMKNDFFKESQLISDLKLRLGWGITGQQDIPPANDYLQQYNIGLGTSQYFFGPVATPIAISGRISPELKWELTSTYNVGLDFGIYSRINGSVDVFYKESTDLLVDAAVSDGANFSNRAWQNVGSFTTKGIEVGVSIDAVKSENFNWNVNVNATAFQRETTELIYNEDIPVGENLTGTGLQGQVLREGFSPYSYLVYKQLYDNQGNPVEGAFADLNGDGIINGDDRYIYRNPDPDATFGFASTMNYKNLDFSFNLRASVGNSIFNAIEARGAQYDQLTTGAGPGNIPTSVLQTNFDTTADVVLSDIYVQDASYLRMDNITLGYTFPKWLEGKASVRLFTGCQNAFIITDYKGLDPEITNNGVDATIYPRQRSFLFGANVKF